MKCVQYHIRLVYASLIHSFKIKESQHRGMHYFMMIVPIIQVFTSLQYILGQKGSSPK